MLVHRLRSLTNIKQALIQPMAFSVHPATIPTSRSHWANVGSMLGHRLRRWTNIKPAFYIISLSGIHLREGNNQKCHGMMNTCHYRGRQANHTTKSWCSEPTGHTTLLRRWINVIDFDLTSQQRRVSSGKYQKLSQCWFNVGPASGPTINRRCRIIFGFSFCISTLSTIF